jgi:uncharacterized protein
VSREAAAPVAQSSRIDAIDVLRGVALLGILTLNIQSFGMPAAAYENPAKFGDFEGVNRWVWRLTHVLAEEKFITIFSMLFGAGVVLMISRAAERGPTLGLHYRRMAALLVFGALHGWFLWYGDILFCYALAGMVAYPFRKLKARTLLICGVGLILAGFGFGALMKLAAPADAAREAAREFERRFPSAAQEIAGYRGDLIDNFRVRKPWTIFMQRYAVPWHLVWRTLANMLVGMALLKWRVFSAERSKRFYAVMSVAGFVIGWGLAITGIVQMERHGFEEAYVTGRGHAFNAIGCEFAALGWIGLVMLVVGSGPGGVMRRALAATGRMAFTNYILQTVLATTVFYGFGLGLFGSVSRTGLLGITIAIWIVLLLWSAPWLERFRFGPLEWIWRTLTYGKRQPFVKSAAVSRNAEDVT